MTNREAKELIEKFRAGSCTEAEEAMLKAWYRSLVPAGGDVPPPPEIEKALKEISRSLPLEKNEPQFKIPFGRIAAAVLVLFLFTAGIYFLQRDRPDSHFAGNIYKNDVAPGGNRAILELADGSLIDLNSANLGDLSQKKSVRITKTREDQVVYEPAGQTGWAQVRANEAPAYNTISTPRGGQYQVVLPDGSGAWLNAASSIRFPAMFDGPERKVEITGEVYFEVSREYQHTDSGKALIPFIVVADDQQIEALGTHFNVNAYRDEGALRATLLEGSVRVSLAGVDASQLLQPGQQARIQAGSISPIAVSRVNAQKTIAWKNGQFQYDNEGIASIMRQVERWYDVEVVYEGVIPDNKFVGTISRDIPLSKFLDILSFTGVNFRIEGRKIVVIS